MNTSVTYKFVNLYYKYLQKFKAKAKRVDEFIIQNKQPPKSETNKWSEEMMYYFQASIESIKGIENKTTNDYKGISKGILLFSNVYKQTLKI